MTAVQPYRPSCGSEGADFTAAWCCRCRRDEAAEQGDGCEILARTFIFDVDDSAYPEEWRVDGPSGPRCTAFVAITPGVEPLDPAAVERPLLCAAGAPLPQRARDAAADHYERVEPFGFGFIGCAIRDGRRDDDPRVQAFASGPLAATVAARNRA